MSNRHRTNGNKHSNPMNPTAVQNYNLIGNPLIPSSKVTPDIECGSHNDNYNYNKRIKSVRMKCGEAHHNRKMHSGIPSHDPAMANANRIQKQKLIQIQQQSIYSTQLKPNSNLSQRLSRPFKTSDLLDGFREIDRKQISLAAFVVFAGLVGFCIFEPLFYGIMDYEFTIKPGRIFQWIWLRNPMAINLDFYFFELKNGDEFLNGAKPILVEHGPFSYYVYRERKIIERSELTVRFTERYKMEPNPDNSSPELYTKYTAINYPIFAGLVIVKNILNQFFIGFLSPIVLNVAALMLQVTGERLIDERSAYELLEGRKINLIAFFEQFLQPMRDNGIPIPEFKIDSFGIQNGTFGFLSLIRSAEIGPIEVFSATQQNHIVSHVFTYGGSTTSPLYKYPCNQIHGSGGILHGPQKQNPRVYIYNRLLCRPIALKNTGVEYFRGTYTYRYEMDDQQFNSSVPRNKCFCYDRSLQKCDGWTNIEACFGGVNAALSLPHFYNSHNRQQELFGMKPNRETHVGYMNLEPNIGIPINAKLGFQANLILDSLVWVPQLSAVRSVIYPIFWAKLYLTPNVWQTIGIFFGIKFVIYGSYLILLASLVLGANIIRKSMPKVSKVYIKQ